MNRNRLATITAARLLLDGETASPVRLSLTNWERKAIRGIVNQPTTKRAKVKAARKQRNKP